MFISRLKRLRGTCIHWENSCWWQEVKFNITCLWNWQSLLCFSHLLVCKHHQRCLHNKDPHLMLHVYVPVMKTWYDHSWTTFSVILPKDVSKHNLQITQIYLKGWFWKKPTGSIKKINVIAVIYYQMWKL